MISCMNIDFFKWISIQIVEMRRLSSQLSKEISGYVLVISNNIISV